MLGRQPVRITYAHKRRRVQNASKKQPSSPLEVLAPDVGDLTRAQMARRMLKRSRRVALAEQQDDEDLEHIREQLAKRIKHTQARVSNLELTEAPLEADDPTPSQSVPVPKRAISRTSSKNLKENRAHPQTLMSPFSSRPGSPAPPPKHKGKKRISYQTSHPLLHAKSRTLSGSFKENTQRVLRKDSTMSLKEMRKKHQGDSQTGSPGVSSHAIAEYDVPVAGSNHSPTPTASIPKLSVGHFCLPGTSPIHGGNIVVGMPRNRVGTTRASDFGHPEPGARHRPLVSPPSHVQRTRSGTVVGPRSKLAAKGAGLPTQVAKGASAKLSTVPSGSESESDDELLLKDFWTEDLVYLGIPAPRDREDVEADELNLGGPWDASEPGLTRRLRKR